jgi:hypothetical protein
MQRSPVRILHQLLHWGDQLSSTRLERYIKGLFRIVHKHNTRFQNKVQSMKSTMVHTIQQVGLKELKVTVCGSARQLCLLRGQEPALSQGSCHRDSLAHLQGFPS